MLEMLKLAVGNLNDRADYYHSIYLDNVGDMYRLRIMSGHHTVRNTELMDGNRMMDCMRWIELGISIAENW